MLTNLMEVMAAAAVAPLPYQPVVDTAINSPFPMDTDDERSSRKRNAKITSEENRRSIHLSKNNFSIFNAFEFHLGASAPVKTKNVSINKYSKNDILPLSHMYTRTSLRRCIFLYFLVLFLSLSRVIFFSLRGLAPAIIEAKTAD